MAETFRENKAIQQMTIKLIKGGYQLDIIR